MMALHCVPIDHLQLQNPVRSADALRQPCGDGRSTVRCCFTSHYFLDPKGCLRKMPLVGRTGGFS